MTRSARHPSSRRSHFAFALWAARQPAPPTVAQIESATGLSYESARLWRQDWCAALAPDQQLNDATRERPRVQER